MGSWLPSRLSVRLCRVKGEHLFFLFWVGKKKVSIGDRVFESPKALKEECRAMLFRYLEVTIDISRFFLFYVKSEA